MTAWKLDIHSRIKKHFIEICRTIKETVYRFEWTIEFKPLDYQSFAEIYPDSGRSRQTWARTISGEYLCSHIMPLEAVTLTMLRLTSLNMGCVGQGRAGTGQSLWIDGLICTVRSINASFPFAVNALPLLMRWYSHQCISRVFDKIKLILCKKFLWFFEMKRLKRQINRIIFKIGQFVHYGSSVCIFLRLSLRSVEITMDLWGDI